MGPKAHVPDPGDAAAIIGPQPNVLHPGDVVATMGPKAHVPDPGDAAVILDPKAQVLDPGDVVAIMGPKAHVPDHGDAADAGLSGEPGPSTSVLKRKRPANTAVRTNLLNRLSRIKSRKKETRCSQCDVVYSQKNDKQTFWTMGRVRVEMWRVDSQKASWLERKTGRHRHLCL